MDVTSRTLPVPRGPYGLHAELTPGTGVPLVLMHGFPDNTHLYDRCFRILPGAGRWCASTSSAGAARTKPPGYPYTATNQAGDLAAVVAALDEHVGAGELVLVAHDASGLPAIDWALANPGRVAMLVLLNTYYHPTAGLRRPPRIAVYSTPIIRAAARAIVRRWPDLDRRFYTWQVGGFIQDPAVRDELVPQLYEQSLPARRSGGSTTTCSPRCSPAGGASATCAASAGPSGWSSVPATATSTRGLPGTSPRCSPTASCTCWTAPGTTSRSTSRSRSPPSSWVLADDPSNLFRRNQNIA